jgi:Flp pilus assembly protein TadD
MLGDLPGAEDTLQKAVRLNPRNASALNNLGALKAMQKDYAAARGYFQQGLLADPAHPEIRRNLEKLDALRAAN